MGDADKTPVDPVPTLERALTPGEGRRVPPNPDKPRLPARVERRLAAADQRSAHAYEEIEDATALLRAAREEGASGAVVEAELDITDSLVHQIVTGEAKKPGG